MKTLLESLKSRGTSALAPGRWQRITRRVRRCRTGTAPAASFRFEIQINVATFNVGTYTSGMKQREGQPAGLAGEIGKKRPFDCPEQEAFLNIVRTADVLSADFARLFRAQGLSMSLYNALRIVAGVGAGGIPVRTIADRMIVREPDITRLVDRLEQRGLVRRCRSEADRRVVRVHITAEGAALVAALHDPVRDLHRRQLGRLPRRSLLHLNELLVAVRQAARPEP